ncbi:GNAT family N-acetyltransferase [Phocaeicola faecium]|nr:GNAT family N-acetyltransferase [Phocaeicola faecium]
MRITAEEWQSLRLIREIGRTERTDEFTEQLVRVWEASVRASHHFLTGEDIRRLSPWVAPALKETETLLVSFQADVPVGFMGIQDRKIEMLFLAPSCIGKGLGKQLVHLAVNRYKVAYVDVNEQNPHAAGFYRHLGFETFRRDENGRSRQSVPHTADEIEQP